MEREITIIGVDPDTHLSGYSIYVVGKKPKLIRCGLVPVAEIDSFFERLGIEIDWLFVEDQYFGINPKGTMRLIEIKTRWKVSAERRNIKYTEVLPNSWQSLIVRTQRKENIFHMKRDQRLEILREFVSQKYADKISKFYVLPEHPNRENLVAYHNICQSIGIGYWGCLEGRKEYDR